MAKKKNEKIWITKEGIIIPVKKMENSHIINAIQYFERLGKGDRKTVIWLKEEAVIRKLDFKGKEKFCNIKVDEPILNRFEILDL